MLCTRQSERHLDLDLDVSGQLQATTDIESRERLQDSKWAEVFCRSHTDLVVEADGIIPTSVENQTIEVQATAVFFGEGPRSICYWLTAALKLIVQPCDEDD